MYRMSKWEIIYRDKLNEHGICIRVIGNFYLIPEDIKKQIAEAMIMTKDNKRAILNVAFAYTCKFFQNKFTYVIEEQNHF